MLWFEMLLCVLDIKGYIQLLTLFLPAVSVPKT